MRRMRFLAGGLFEKSARRQPAQREAQCIAIYDPLCGLIAILQTIMTSVYSYKVKTQKTTGHEKEYVKAVTFPHHKLFGFDHCSFCR